MGRRRSSRFFPRCTSAWRSVHRHVRRFLEWQGLLFVAGVFSSNFKRSSLWPSHSPLLPHWLSASFFPPLLLLLLHFFRVKGRLLQSLAALSRCTGGSAQTGSAGSRSWMPFVCLFFFVVVFFHKDVQMNVDVRSSGISRDLKRCCDLDASLSDSRHRLSSVTSINRCSVPPHSHPYNIVLYQSFPFFAYVHPTSLPSQWRWLLWLIRCSWGHAANESGVWRDNSVCICMRPRATTAFFSVLHIKDFLTPPLKKKTFLGTWRSKSLQSRSSWMLSPVLVSQLVQGLRGRKEKICRRFDQVFLKFIFIFFFSSEARLEMLLVQLWRGAFFTHHELGFHDGLAQIPNQSFNRFCKYGTST